MFYIPTKETLAPESPFFALAFLSLLAALQECQEGDSNSPSGETHTLHSLVSVN